MITLRFLMKPCARLLSPWAAALVVANTPSVALAWQAFTDVTAQANVGYVQWRDDDPDLAIAEARYMTGGAAAEDFDRDGWVDLFVTRLDDTDILYRNRGDGTFEDVSEAAGFTHALPTNGAVWGDVDNDGDADLYLTSVLGSHYYLYINDGTGHFTEQAASRGADAAAEVTVSGYGVTMGDYDRDGYLDIHTTDWGARSAPDGVPRPNAARLLRNQGPRNAGHFQDVTESSGVSLGLLDAYGTQGPVNGVYAFASRFSDMDGDGWQDLLIAGDFHSSRLFWNNRDGTFSDGTEAAGVGSDENGMGSAIGDYDGDGRLDWFVTSIYDPDATCDTQQCNWGYTGNRLYRNSGERGFVDQTDLAGVRDGGWGWGAAFLDYDHDRDLDLVMTNGVDFPSVSDGDQPFNPGDVDAPFNQDPMRLWRNDDGVFTEVAALEGVTDSASGKGLLTLDYDNDGDLDLFVVNNRGGPVLYRNNTDSRMAWLQVEAVGTASNRDGIGSRLTLDPDHSVAGDEMVREINTGSHFLGQSSSTAHFGLGELDGTIDSLRIDWPSGSVSRLRHLLPNQILVVVEPVPEPEPMVLLLSGGLLLAGRLRCGRRSATGGDQERIANRMAATSIPRPTRIATVATGDSFAGYKAPQCGQTDSVQCTSVPQAWQCRTI